MSRSITLADVVKAFYKAVNDDCKTAVNKINCLTLSSDAIGVEASTETRIYNVLLSAHYLRAMFDLKMVNLMRKLYQNCENCTFVVKELNCHYK